MTDSEQDAAQLTRIKSESLSYSIVEDDINDLITEINTTVDDPNIYDDFSPRTTRINSAFCTDETFKRVVNSEVQLCKFLQDVCCFFIII